MVDSPKQGILVVSGRRLNKSKDDGIVSGEGANILQATPRVGETIKLGLHRSEETETLSLENKDDVVELVLEDNLLLYTSVGRLQDEIIPATQRGPKHDEITLPTRLTFSNQRTRGEDGLLIESLKLLDIKSKLIDAAAKKGGEFAARKIATKIEEQLVGPDILYRLVENTTKNTEKITLLPAIAGDVITSAPILLFIHGTASSTRGSFSELWERSGGHGDTVWQDLQKEYNNNIFALEHRTLTHSPIDNVVDLMEKLPAGCRLHMVSHSRGGLLGELLCRSQFNNSREPFTKEDIALFNSKKLSSRPELFAEIKNDYKHHQEQLKKLNVLLVEKQPVIEKFVRVACPARGTTLASGKLDIYLSGILNVIGLIPALRASTVYDLLKVFTLAVARERTRPEQLPGLEAQMPGSPFIAMLNSATESVKAHLAVIKGDVEPTGILKKISMFFLDRFYESDHDLVVNTPSMDGGARREKQIPVLFDQGKNINHFRYFENTKTRQGLFAGLIDPTLPPKGFKLEEQKAAYIARTLPRGKKHNEVPSVFVLPGITGSHLEINNNRIWIDFFDLVRGKFNDLRFETSPNKPPKALTVNSVEAEKPVAKAYGDLIDYLAQQNHVIPFAYDWRSSVLEAGKRLGAAVDERLRNSEQPVRIIAHSMGGLVARGMMCECKEVWDRMRERKGSRLLMLGTPNRGSHSIVRIFARQEKLIKLLALADVHHNQNELIKILRRFPGVLELLPVDDTGKIDIDDSTWSGFSEVLPSGWEGPLKMDLKWSQKTWDKLTKAELDPDTVFYIAGRAKETPVAVEVTKTKPKEIIFSATSKGDGQVPWKTGIPAGITHWYVNAIHGDLADHQPAFNAFVEILETGTTSLLAQQPPVARDLDQDAVMLPDTVDIFPNEELLLAAAMGRGVGGRPSQESGMIPLHVSILHGNLRFTRSPLAVGHYQGDTIVSAEAVLDGLLGGRLTKRQQNGIYPGALHTNEILFNSSKHDFPGAVIVGLGEVGELQPGTLTKTFRDAAIRYALICRETGQFVNEEITLSTLLIGTGAGELTAKDSIAALMQAVIQANLLLAGPTSNVDHCISKLEFIELHEDVAIEAQHALIDVTTRTEFSQKTTCDQTINIGNGGQRRAYFSEDADWWQRLRIETTPEGGLKYTTLGTRARAEMQIQAVQRRSVEPFLRALTDQTSADENAGRVLFELLIPQEMKHHAADNQRLMLIVDKEAAAYPWELLEYSGREGNEALAIKAGMIRQLVTIGNPPTNLCNDKNALIVGDPFAGNDNSFPDLPGARREARAVAKILEKNRIQIKDTLIRESGTKILTQLLTGEFGFLHLAGHGVVDFEPKSTFDNVNCINSKTKITEKITGMLIGENQFLTPIEIKQMRHTPAFVFINCCHLGQIIGSQKPYMGQRYHLAANLAAQFIEQGVKAVIAAGWAVDDQAALTFATTFYTTFLKGNTFGNSVQEARAATQDRHPSVNTWGAYQCYGDPDYSFTAPQGRIPGSDPKRFVSLAEYVVAIENIAQDAATASYNGMEHLAKKLQTIVNQVPEKYSSNAKLLAVIGDAWGELDHFKEAIEAYNSALMAQKAYAPIRCAEQLANFKCRRAVEKRDQLPIARKLTDEAIAQLQYLNSQFGETVERLALLGRTCKRRAEIEKGNKAFLQQYLEKMQTYYMLCYKTNLDSFGKVVAYPLLNGLTAQWFLSQTGNKNTKLANFNDLLSIAKQANMVPEINPEHFWENITVTDCELLAALKDDQLDKKQAQHIAANYIRIGKVAPSARQMQSVKENLHFLYTMAKHLQLKQANDLHWLSNQLKVLH